MPKALACPSSRGSPGLAPAAPKQPFKEAAEVHTVTNNVQWSARLAVVPAARAEEVEVADTDVVQLLVTFATTVTARCHQGRAEEEAVQGTASGTAASALDSGESAPPPLQALPVKVERLTNVPDPPKPALLFQNKQHHVDDYKEVVVPQLMVDVVSPVTTEFLPKALPRLPAPLSVAGHLGQDLSELETTGESSHRRSLDIDPVKPIVSMNGNYKFNSSGDEHCGRVLYEPRGVLLGNYDQQTKIFGGGRFGKVSLPEISTLDLEHANVFLGNSATNFSCSLFAQRKLTISRSVSAKDNFDFDSLSSFQSPLALDNAGPWVSRVSQPNSPDVFIVRPNLELFSISSRTPFLELSAADRADQAGSRTLTAKVQLPQEVPPEPPPLKLCSFLALPSPCVLFSLLDFVTLKQLPIVSCSDNNMNIENSAADPLFCETFVTAPTETVGVFFVLQRNLDFTAAVKSCFFCSN